MRYIVCLLLTTVGALAQQVTVCSSGCDYTTLEAAISANEADILITEGQDENPSATMTIDTANTVVEVSAAARHPGWRTSSPSHYRVTPAGTFHVFTITADNVTLIGLDIEQAGSTTSAECIRYDPGANSNLTIRDCLFKTADVSQQDCIYVTDNDFDDLTVENCIFWGARRNSINVEFFSVSGPSDQGVVNVNSCTFYDQYEASTNMGHLMGDVRETGDSITFNVFNCLFAEADGTEGCLAENVSGGGTVTWNVSYSILDDGSLTTVGLDAGTGNMESYTFADTDQGSGNYVIHNDLDVEAGTHDLRLQDLGNSNNKAQDDHTDTTEHGMTIVSADVVDTSRPQNTSYDIGAFEIVAAAAGGASPGKRIITLQ
jgi:hypothetical protein